MDSVSLQLPEKRKTPISDKDDFIGAELAEMTSYKLAEMTSYNYMNQDEFIGAELAETTSYSSEQNLPR